MIRLVTNERILMPIVFVFIFYGYNTRIYNFLYCAEVDYAMLLMHIIGVSILSYLLMLAVVFIVLVVLYIKLTNLDKSNCAAYTFFNQLEALSLSIDTFVDSTNTIEEFNSKFKEVLEDNFTRWQ